MKLKKKNCPYIVVTCAEIHVRCLQALLRSCDVFCFPLCLGGGVNFMKTISKIINILWVKSGFALLLLYQCNHIDCSSC